MRRLAALIVLLGCGGGTGGAAPDKEIWPISIPYYVGESGHVRIPTVINGQSFDCVFDTGAPGLWVTPGAAEEWSAPTVTMGNYERDDIVAWWLTEDMQWTECLIGLPFFGDMDVWIDQKNEVVRAK